MLAASAKSAGIGRGNGTVAVMMGRRYPKSGAKLVIRHSFAPDSGRPDNVVDPNA
jgi:hypothetical protein